MMIRLTFSILLFTLIRLDIYAQFGQYTWDYFLINDIKKAKVFVKIPEYDKSKIIRQYSYNNQNGNVCVKYYSEKQKQVENYKLNRDSIIWSNNPLYGVLPLDYIADLSLYHSYKLKYDSLNRVVEVLYWTPHSFDAKHLKKLYYLNEGIRLECWRKSEVGLDSWISAAYFKFEKERLVMIENLDETAGVISATHFFYSTHGLLLKYLSEYENGRSIYFIEYIIGEQF